MEREIPRLPDVLGVLDEHVHFVLLYPSLDDDIFWILVISFPRYATIVHESCAYGFIVDFKLGVAVCAIHVPIDIQIPLALEDNFDLSTNDLIMYPLNLITKLYKSDSYRQ